MVDDPDPFLNKPISVNTERLALPWLNEISNESFREALISTLKSRGLYAEYGTYALSANLVKVEKPLLALNVKITTHIQYILKNTTTNQTIIDKLIVASSTVSVGDELTGMKRQRVANENSAKENIKMFLADLSKASMSSTTFN